MGLTSDLPGFHQDGMAQELFLKAPPEQTDDEPVFPRAPVATDTVDGDNLKPARGQKIPEVSRSEIVQVASVESYRIVRCAWKSSADKRQDPLDLPDIGSRKNQMSARSHNAMQLADEPDRIEHVLDHVEGDNRIERIVRIRRRLGVQIDAMSDEPLFPGETDGILGDVNSMDLAKHRAGKLAERSLPTADIQEPVAGIQKCKGIAHTEESIGSRILLTTQFLVPDRRIELFFCCCHGSCSG